MLKPSKLDSETLAFVRSVDSPTVANALEKIHRRDRTEGYLGGEIRCFFPELGVMVGHALTVTVHNERGPVADREGHWRMWSALRELPEPRIVVVKDLSGAPNRCAYFGEVMASIATGCGAVGMVTDGGVRDLAEVKAIGFRYFAQYAVVSHGNFRIVDVGLPIVLGGQRIENGDILHGDMNGIVVVPEESLTQLPAAVEQIRHRERGILERVRRPGFTLEALHDVY